MHPIPGGLEEVRVMHLLPLSWRNYVRPPIPNGSGGSLQHSPLLPAPLFRIHSLASSSYLSNQRTVVRSGFSQWRHTCAQVPWQCSLSVPDSALAEFGPEQAALGGGQCGASTQKWDQQLLPVVQLLHSPRREFLGDLSGLLFFQLIFICLFWVLLSQTRNLNSAG